MSTEPKKKGSTMVPDGGNDCVPTPPALARLMVRHFRPCGRILEPCAGPKEHQPIVDALSEREQVSSCHQVTAGDILYGADFLKERAFYDWIITNPPFSKFRAFLNHSMELADNVVFLAPSNHWSLSARQRDMAARGFGMVEQAIVPQPPTPWPWPRSGFELSATWIRRGWSGSLHRHRLEVSYD